MINNVGIIPIPIKLVDAAYTFKLFKVCTHTRVFINNLYVMLPHTTSTKLTNHLTVNQKLYTIYVQYDQ